MLKAKFWISQPPKGCQESLTMPFFLPHGHRIHGIMYILSYLIPTKSDVASKSRQNCIFIQDTILFIFNQRDGQFCNIFIALANLKWKTLLMLKTNKIIEDIQI